MRFVAALVLALCACTPPPPTPDAGPPLTIGTGSSSFVELHDGDEVNIITGPQGGHHIWGALRATHVLNPNNLTVHYFVLIADGGTEISDNPYRITLVANGDVNEWYGLIGFLPDAGAVNGVPTVLRMDVQDADGKTASDQRRVLPRAP